MIARRRVTEIEPQVTATQARDMLAAVMAAIGQMERAHARARRLLLEFRDRGGHRALGFATLRECVEARFGVGRRHAYALIDAAETEQACAPVFKPIQDRLETPVSEWALRPLKRIPIERRADVMNVALSLARQESSNGQITITSSHTTRAVKRWLDSKKPAECAAAHTGAEDPECAVGESRDASLRDGLGQPVTNATMSPIFRLRREMQSIIIEAQRLKRRAMDCIGEPGSEAMNQAALTQLFNSLIQEMKVSLPHAQGGGGQGWMTRKQFDEAQGASEQYQSRSSASPA